MLIQLLLAAPALLALGPATRVPAPASPYCAGDAGDTVEVVEIATTDKLKLQGDYYAPRSAGDLAPGVLLVHDAGGNRQQLTEMAESLRKKGFGVLAVDLRGHGKSATSRFDWSKMSAEEHAKLWGYSTRDLEACALWLRDKKELHATNLNLVGLGRGCTLVVKHAGRDENVRSIVLLDPNQEQLGYDLQGDILEIAGLPTFYAYPRGNRGYAESIIEIANNEAGTDFVEPHPLSPRIDGVLDDKKLPSEVAKWIAEKAMPKRGRR
jgi:dienelactone hydrolase